MIKSLLLSASLLSSVVVVQGQQPGDANVTVGAEICTFGFIMDEYCIDNINLLDAPSSKTLEEPGKHTVHCLVDVGLCYNTPFHILEENPPNLDTPYGPGWAVDDNALLMDSARIVGDCSTCNGGGSLKKGYRAEVMGTVLTVDPPVLQVAQVRALDEGEIGCVDPTDPASVGQTTIAADDADTPAAGTSGATSTIYSAALLLGGVLSGLMIIGL